MGDRRMAEIKTVDGSLFIYTHGQGYSLPKRAEAAIMFANGRWNDNSYCLRILVDQLTKGDRDSECGSGLMLSPGVEDEYNNDKPSVIIDIPNQTLEVIGEGFTFINFSEIT